MTKRSKPAAAPAATARDPSDEEQRYIREAAARQLKRPRRPTVDAQVTTDGSQRGVKIDAPHSDRAGWSVLLNDAFGSRSRDFVSVAMSDLMNILDHSAEKGSEAYNAALALIASINPQNELEAALACQIAATHGLSMQTMGYAARTDRVDFRETYVGQSTKLSRTMAAQVDMLNKLRTGGKQVIQVVHVNGPAIVGDNAQTVITGGVPGDGHRIAAQPDAPAALAHITATVVPTVWSEDEERQTVPVTSGEGSS